MIQPPAVTADERGRAGVNQQPVVEESGSGGGGRELGERDSQQHKASSFQGSSFQGSSLQREGSSD